MRDLMAIPIVAIVFLSIFGAPVAIVVMIGIFSHDRDSDDGSGLSG